MSEENNPFDKAKESASDAYDSTKETFNEAADAAKESARDFQRGLNDTVNNGDNKKLLAGLLGIFLGSLGVHKFILGYQKEGFILAGLTVIGWITTCVFFGIFIVMATYAVGLIEGIIYLTKSDEEFYNTYQAGRKPWF
ncbi:membrane protein [Nonlabens sp. MIC269]|uniref:TM2 domain-containing protein n=1 Tax=Nonlabens sp. MIC269 TaxID=1476901 RepID=UPI00071EB2A0|nr:TM2 domain-containing protein [Nonlabens sp. MIC269]ALM20829.1 membrane protein [Nonlabens sp. MIC269]